MSTVLRCDNKEVEVVHRGCQPNQSDDYIQLGEGSLWDNEAQILYWIDITGQKLFVYDPIVNEEKCIRLPQPPGTVVQTKEKGIVLVPCANGYYFVNTLTSEVSYTGIDPESHLPNNRFNDGKCDPRGRLVAGTMHVDAKTKHTGALYSLNEKYNVTKLLDRVSISNGIVWSKDGHCMYYIDTFEYNVVSYDYNLNDGTISNRRVIFEFEESKYGSPDGMTIDENDNLWIAFWNGSKVRQFDPRQQKELSEINLPVRFVTSCAFGGSDLNDLYITCAASENKKDFDFAPLAGSLFVVKNIGVRGVPSVPFAGDVKSFLK